MCMVVMLTAYKVLALRYSDQLFIGHYSPTSCGPYHNVLDLGRSLLLYPLGQKANIYNT